MPIHPENSPNTSGRQLGLAILVLATGLQLIGCTADITNQSGGGGSTTSNANPSSGYSVGGKVTGLMGAGLMLQLNGTYLDVSEAGAFTFPQGVVAGSSYSVTIQQQPSNPDQACSVANGSGSMTSANVTNVSVSCSTQSFQVTGIVTGVIGTGLVLQTNGIAIPVTGNAFSVSLPSGTAYSITVSTQPPNPPQNCVVANGTGLVTDVNVSGVSVTCSTNMVSVGGTITGLTGSGLVLQTNGTNVPISGNTFSVYLDKGTAYNIMATAQPSSPTQTCTVANGSGTANATVNNVVVNCTSQTFTLSGSISNLQGTGFVLQNNGTVIPLSGNSYSLSLASGTPYNITVAQQPSSPSETCVPRNGSGTIGSSNVVVPVVCSINTYSVSVAVSGLQNGGRGLSVLNNGSGTQPIAGNGTFVVSNEVPSGQPYAVSIGSQPAGTSPAQYCLLPNGAGTVTNANVSVALTCRNVGQALFSVNTLTDPRNNNPGDISGFAINPANGNLSAAPGSPFAAGTIPYGISLDTQHQILYAINNRSNDISTFSVSPTTAVLTGIHVSPGYPASGAFGGGFSVLVNPQAPQYVYAGSDQAPDGLVDLFNASTTGVLSAPDPTGAGNDPEYMALNPAGTLLFVPQVFDNTIFVYSIGVNGVLTPVAGTPSYNTLPGGGNSGPAAIAVSPTARNVYVAGLFNASVTAYSYDDTGNLTLLGPPVTFGTGTAVGVIPPGDGLAIDPTGRFLYVTSPVDNTVTEYGISSQTGLLTQVGAPVATGNAPSDVKIDPSGHYAYVTNYTDGTISEFDIDPNTGALTEDHNSPFQSGPGVQSIAVE